MVEGGKAGEVLASRKNDLTVVAQDRNWRTYVAKELRDADQWASDWGFLASNSDGKSTHFIQYLFGHRRFYKLNITKYVYALAQRPM